MDIERLLITIWKKALNPSLVIPSVVISLLVTISFMVSLRPVAGSIGLVDRPGGRKHHYGDVPLIGGIAMFLGVVAGVAVIGDPSIAIGSLAVASLLLVSVGVIDDIHAVPPMVRIVVQIAAILLMIYGANLSLSGIGSPFGLGEIGLGPFTLIGTLVVGITVVNAYNLVDGSDGLAGTLSIVTLTALAVAGGGGMFSGVALVAIAATTGFLIFNFPLVHNRRIRAYMGDAGSTFLGFLIVGVALSITQGENRSISPVAVLWFAAIPLYDLFTCFVTRLLSGKSPFTAGRDHLHHWLRRGGFNCQEAVFILGGLQALYASIALVGHFAGTPDFVLFFGWSVLGLTQSTVIRSIAKHHRRYLLGQLRDRKLDPEHGKRARLLRS